MTNARSVACPRCGKVAPYSPANPHRPFCSQRCKLIDLGSWANEEYRVPVNDPAQPETQDETSPQPP